MHKITFLSLGIFLFMVSCHALGTPSAPEATSPTPRPEVESIFGENPAASTDTPVPALPLKEAKIITSSIESGCAITTDGETRCWYTFHEPAIMEGLPPLAGLECRAEYCLGFTSGGDLYEWYISEAQAQVLEDIQGVSDVAMGDRFSCAITLGAVKCWGSVPGRDRTGNTDGTVTDEPIFDGPGWRLADAAATYACFLGDGAEMCIGFFPRMGTNRYAHGFNPHFGAVDLRFSEAVYCVIDANGEVACSDNEVSNSIPEGFFSNAVDFDVSDHLSCRINPDKSVECIKDNVVTAVKDLKADAASIKTSGRKATILLSDGSIAVLETHPEYKITYLPSFGSP